MHTSILSIILFMTAATLPVAAQTGASISTSGQNITMQKNVTVTGPLTSKMSASAPVIGGVVIVTAYASAGDLGQQFAAAYAANGQTAYYIPAGTYTTSHTISITPQASGNISLRCAPGTTIQYTGSGDAFAALGNGQSQANLVLSGCRFTWAGSTGNANGVHLEAFNKATINNVSASGFTHGDGFLNQGVNTVDFYNIQSTDNLNGVQNVGVVVGGVNFAANALHFTGGMIANNSQWGIYEDGALAGTVGPDSNNTYRDIAFESNGTPSATSPSGGQIFIQNCLGCGIYSNYFEYAYSGNLTMTSQLVVGDVADSPSDTLIRDNFFASNGGHVTSAINLVNSNRATIDGNLDEDNPESNFVSNGSLSQWTYIGFNDSNASSYVSGPGTTTASVTIGGITANTVSAGTHVVYRCTAAGTLPVGTLTVIPANCRASTDTGLRVR